MPCPTCDHTLQAVTADVPAVGGRPVFWCPRCGTLCHGNDCEAPKLVERCREWEVALWGCLAEIPISPEVLKEQWHRVGIAESINLPGNRPNKE